VGPHIHDPRTGEILNADIQFYHNIMNLHRTAKTKAHLEGVRDRIAKILDPKLAAAAGKTGAAIRIGFDSFGQP